MKRWNNMNAQQFIEYTKWLDKKGIAFCDGSTAEPMLFYDIVINAIIVGGIFGVFSIIYHKFKGDL